MNETDRNHIIGEMRDLIARINEADVIASLDKMGEASTKNLLDAIDAAKTTPSSACCAGRASDS